MLKRLVLIIGFLSLAQPAYAAFDDVSLTADATFTLTGLGINLTVSSGSKVASFTVKTGSIDFNMEDGSVATVRSADKNTLSNSLVSTSCHSDYSYVTLTSKTTQTVTVTPIAGSRASCYGGSSGGGGSPPVPALAPAPAPAPPPAPAETPSTVLATGLTVGQVTAILDVLRSFDVDAATLETVETILRGTPAAAPPAMPAVGSFTRALTLGSTGADVLALQQVLNADGVTVASSGPGSPGSETSYFGPLTRDAVQRFQLKYGIVADSSDPGYGFVGPKTRAKINQLLGL